MKMTRFAEWLRSQHGPGRRYSSARQLAEAAGVSEGTVRKIVATGVVKLETLLKFAGPCDVSPIYLMALAADVDFKELAAEGFEAVVLESPEELQLLKAYRRLPPNVCEGILSVCLSVAGQSLDDLPEWTVPGASLPPNGFQNLSSPSPTPLLSEYDIDSEL